MSDWADVARTDEIPPGGSKLVYVDGVKVAVFNLGGEYHAIEDICTHDGGELASGTVEGEEIVCPRHGATLNIEPGTVARADDFFAFDRPAGEFPAVVRADVLDRVAFAAEVEYRDLDAIQIHQLRSARWDFTDLSDIRPV